MPGRSYSTGNGYRYGFNGKEKSDEVYSTGNIYDYGFRIYNPRIGKFLSVDPLTKKYPELTTYQFASNSPIAAIDLDGLEAKIVTDSYWLGSSGNSMISTTTSKDVDNPYGFGNGTLHIIKYDKQRYDAQGTHGNVINVVNYYPPTPAKVIADALQGKYVGGRNKFGFILKGNENGTTFDVETDKVEFKETLDVGVLLKLIAGMKDYSDMQSITDFMKSEKFKKAYEIAEKGLSVGDRAVNVEEQATSSEPSNSSDNKMTHKLPKGPYKDLQQGDIVHPKTLPDGSNIEVIDSYNGETSSKPATDTIESL